MPHLSPMSWLLAPLLFLLITVPAIMAFLWWSQSPIFPSFNLTHSEKKINPWNWS